MNAKIKGIVSPDQQLAVREDDNARHPSRSWREPESLGVVTTTLVRDGLSEESIAVSDPGFVSH